MNPFAVPADGRTRVKLCGLVRADDVDAAVALDVDALGFVFYGPSARHVTPQQAARLVARVPPTIATVGLFVDAARAEVEAVLAIAPLTLLQFHGDESPAGCAGFAVPHLKAVPMRAGVDLLDFATRYCGRRDGPEAQHDGAVALLLDTPSAGHGGSGKVFDWSLVPAPLVGTVRAPVGAPRVVLSGGLNAANVADAIRAVRPFAVDVSSGIERGGSGGKGIKDAAAMRDFVAAVRSTDR